MTNLTENFWKNRCFQAGFSPKNYSGKDPSAVSWRGLFCLQSAIHQCLANSKPAQSTDDRSYVHHLDLSPYPEFDDKVIGELVNMFPNLTSAIFNGCVKVGPKTAKALASCFNLKKLSLINCRFTHFGEIKALFEKKTLKNLQLSHSSIDACLWSLISSCALHKLTLEQCEWNVEALALNSLENLNELTLSSERGLRIDALTFFLKGLRQLKVLELPSNRIAGAKLVQSLPNTLLCLDLSWSEYLKDIDLQMLSVNCPHLQKISFARCQLLTDQALSHLNALQELVDIDLSNCKLMTAEGIGKFLIKHQNLKSLNCVGCSVDQTLLKAKSTLNQIHSLALPADFPVSWFKDLDVTNLRNLKMNSNLSLDDEGIQVFLPTLLASKVESLDLIGCCIASSAFSKLMKLQHLKSLRIGGRIGQFLTIKKLDFLLLEGLGHLETLHISLARDIDFDTLKLMMKRCKSLQRIEIGPLVQMTLKEIDQLRKLYPMIEVHHYGYRGLPDFVKGLIFSEGVEKPN